MNKMSFFSTVLMIKVNVEQVGKIQQELRTILSYSHDRIA